LRDIMDHMTADWPLADYFCEEIVTSLREGNVADGLRAIQGEFAAVAIGSYPVKTARGYQVRIVMRARDRDLLARVRDRVSALVAASESGSPAPGA
jgi:molybdopterin-biosynthesis enzyme MoeA-like protein